MKHYNFEPKGKGKKASYVGSWSDTPSRHIDLPFGVDSLRKVLEWGTKPEGAPFTHHEIAHWCDRMFMAFLDTDSEPKLAKAVRVAADVDCQWDLFLANSYSVTELQRLDFSKVQLPLEWFSDWLINLNEN